MQQIGEIQKASRLGRRRQVTDTDRASQEQTVAIKRGLFLIRYATAEDEAYPPKITVTPDAASNNDIRFLLHPDHSDSTLWQPDACLVVRAAAPGTLSVQVTPIQAGGSTAATVRIEPLSQGTATIPLAPRKKRHTLTQDLDDFRILGHVSGRGDVLVNGGEWIAGPMAPSRIEGISIEWPDKPDDLDIHYAVKTPKPQTISGRKMTVGSFAGTRGKAMPIVGLMLEMSGNAAADLQFSVEAIFLGSPTKQMIGKRIVVSGPTGREPLVGLRIALERVSATARTTAKPVSTKPERTTGRVRVFRSRSKYNLPVPGVPL